MSSGTLSKPQLQRLIACCRVGRYGSLLDVGCGDGTVVALARKIGLAATGIDDPPHLEHDGEVPKAPQDVCWTSVAADIPFHAQSFDGGIVRGTRALTVEADSPELFIALANIFSCIKPRGHVAFVMSSEATDLVEPLRWQQRLAGFPVRFSDRTLRSTFREKLSISGLFRPAQPISVIDVQIPRKPISRLEWHRLACEAVMRTRRSATPAAA